MSISKRVFCHYTIKGDNYGLLNAENANKIYPNGFHAVHDFNLEMEKGEFIVFVGPSGCGKTTPLRMIAGLEDISNGEFRIDGGRANEQGPRERGVAMVFQSYALYPQMTVYDNIAYGLELQGADEDYIDEKVRNSGSCISTRSTSSWPALSASGR